MLFALLKGFFTGASLIIAIGAQNAFVLHQGLRQQHHLTVATICVMVDVVLIFIGVAGLGVLLQKTPVLLDIARWGGAVFLAAYGARSLWKAFAAYRIDKVASGNRGNVNTAGNNEMCDVLSVGQAVVITLSLSLLNPHVYLDTVVLLGAIGGQLPDLGWFWFWIGASMASCCWFFALSLVAKQLAPWFARPATWQLLDVVIGLVMLTIAIQLVRGNF
jgi:L-lysine exporter family protein LysE/ArgO